MQSRGFAASSRDARHNLKRRGLDGLMVPRADLVPLDMSVDQALKYIISMGVVVPPPSSLPPARPGEADPNPQG